MKMVKKYNDNVMTPTEYRKMKRAKAENLRARRKSKGKLSNKRIDELYRGEKPK